MVKAIAYLTTDANLLKANPDMTPITGTVTFEQADAGSELKITYKIENQKFVPQKTYATPEDKVKNLANVTENFQKKEVDGKIACGFHIHQFGDASNGCASAGPHFNPKGQAHGNVDDEERHAGDLGNIYFEKDGKSSGDITLPKESSTTLFGENSIIGRTIVLHGDWDNVNKGDDDNRKPLMDLKVHEASASTGNAGARTACAVIGIAK